jgi:His/Glu/Gln/Arg/opine family amino acid ABC transporter permease subunit
VRCRLRRQVRQVVRDAPTRLLVEDVEHPRTDLDPDPFTALEVPRPIVLERQIGLLAIAFDPRLDKRDRAHGHVGLHPAVEAPCVRLVTKGHVLGSEPEHDLRGGGDPDTLRVAVVGIALATVLGTAVGVWRLSRNLLVNRLCFAYVELVRNTPLLLQMFFWYFAVFLKLPPAREAGTWYGGLIVSSQGAFMPWPSATGPIGPFASVLAAGPVLAIVAYLVHRRLGRGGGGVLALGVLAAIWSAGFVATGLRFELSYPELGPFRVTGGINLSPEFTAVLLGLVVYAAAFIAEVRSVVRSSRSPAGNARPPSRSGSGRA